MSTSKHDKSAGEGPFTSDLDRDPGIGRSGGTKMSDANPDLIAGDSTEEGDVENGAGAQGQAGESQLGRTNS